MQTPTGIISAGELLSAASCEEVAALLGMTYADLGKLAYGMPDSLKYVSFTIPKRSGGRRRIQAPCTRLKAIQSRLSDVFYEVYRPADAAHGFTLDRSIITNAHSHLGKSAVLNVDLEDYFASINFGRIRGLFKSRPFGLPDEVATVLAQLCCFQDRLPQGAPTSPILANMVSYRLDRQLQGLAARHRATYTRYADDITFSFRQERPPRDIASYSTDGVQLGAKLVGIVESNGFKVNPSKVRFATKARSRMSVTGITVNETLNVRRAYVREVRSMLRAWDRFGLESAQSTFNSKRANRHHASDTPKSFPDVVRGRLLYMRNVRGLRDDIYCRAASYFNSLARRDGLERMQLKVVPPTANERTAHDALWVISSEFSYGTGFSVREGYIVTCAHCVCGEDGQPLSEVTVFKCRDHRTQWRAEVVHTDAVRDLAVCRPVGYEMNTETCIDFSDAQVTHGTDVVLLGFPGYYEGSLENRIAASVTNPLLVAGPPERRLVRRFEIDKTIHHGASGGPVVTEDGHLLGVAAEGAIMVLNKVTLGGRNTVVHHSEVRAFLDALTSQDEAKDAATRE